MGFLNEVSLLQLKAHYGTKCSKRDICDIDLYDSRRYLITVGQSAVSLLTVNKDPTSSLSFLAFP